MYISAKQFVVEKLEAEIQKNKDLTVLDLGSGQSRNFLPLFLVYPWLRYVGVEPNKKEAETARDVLKNFPNAVVINQSAYHKPRGFGEFDVCISLSALEHIKQLDIFLQNSVRWTKRGGQIIHFYDLGHALYPSGPKEQFHVFLGNYFPFLLPELKFMRYVNEKNITRVLEESGAKVERVTYHQMPSHRAFLKRFGADSEEKLKLAREILAWEFAVSPFVCQMPQAERERLFPSVCIWAQKS